MDRTLIMKKRIKVMEKMKHFGNSTGLKEECPISIIDITSWEWAQGVGLYGILHYWKETKDEKAAEFLRSWFSENIKKGPPERNVNTTCPMLTLTYLLEEKEEEEFMKLCVEWAEWVMKGLPRTEEGGFQHIVSGILNEGQIWMDTLFMTVLFLTRMGILNDQREYVEEAIRQFLLHIKYITDTETGLFFHGWNFIGRHNFSKARWGRGNAWYTAGVVDFVEMLPDLNHGVRDFLLDTLKSQVNALEKYQGKDGMWHTLIDDPSSYTETSATAGFAYGILKGVRLGVLDARYRDMGMKAAKAVLEQIDEEGVVHQVSYGTGIGKDLDAYRNIEICPMMYGQALALMLLNEVLKVV